MNFIESVELIIPDIISKNLETGEYIRNGGIIQNKEGRIVTWLKEVKLPSNSNKIPQGLIDLHNSLNFNRQMIIDNQNYIKNISDNFLSHLAQEKIKEIKSSYNKIVQAIIFSKEIPNEIWGECLGLLSKLQTEIDSAKYIETQLKLIHTFLKVLYVSIYVSENKGHKTKDFIESNLNKMEEYIKSTYTFMIHPNKNLNYNELLSSKLSIPEINNLIQQYDDNHTDIIDLMNKFKRKGRIIGSLSNITCEQNGFYYNKLLNDTHVRDINILYDDMKLFKTNKERIESSLLELDFINNKGLTLSDYLATFSNATESLQEAPSKEIYYLPHLD